MGMAFYKSRIKKFFYSIIGLILAIFLHSIFNFFILLNDTTHHAIFFWAACLGTWILMIILLISFEKVKKVTIFKEAVRLARKRQTNYGIIIAVQVNLNLKINAKK
jgi:hypothetical protein